MGKLLLYLTVLTVASVLFTAFIGAMNYKGIRIIPFKWHPVMAAISITLVLIQAGLIVFIVGF